MMKMEELWILNNTLDGGDVHQLLNIQRFQNQSMFLLKDMPLIILAEQFSNNI